MADSVPSLSAAGSSPQKTTGTALRKKTSARKKPAARGIPTGGDRLAAWLANPGLRSRLPDGALPADLLAVRQRNQYNASPAAPGSSYTNKQLDDLVSMLTRQKYGGAELALQQQGQALTNRATTQIPAWFQAYRDQIAGAQAAQQQAAAQQVGSLQQMATQAAGDTGGLAGAPMDAEGAARAQAAAQIRSAGVSNQAALAQNLGGIQNAFLGNLGVLSNGQQQAALLGVGQQQNDLAARIAQLAADKGDYKTTQRQQVLSDEADSALKAALTEAQTGAQKASAAATRASTAKTKVETTKTKAEQDYFKKHGYYPKTGPTEKKSPDVITSGPFAGETKQSVAKMSPKKKQQIKDDYAKQKNKDSNAADGKDEFGNTKEQRRSAQNGWNGALDYLRTYPSVSGKPTTVTVLQKAVPNLPHDIAVAAAYWASHKGTLSDDLWRQMRRLGVPVSTDRRK
jgi:hypothetical protein